MELTLLELNIPDAEFNAPYSKGQSSETDSSSTDEASPTEPSSISPLAPVLGLGFLVALALIVKLVRSRTGESS